MYPVFIITHFTESDRFKVVKYLKEQDADQALELPGEPDEVCYKVCSKADMKMVPDRVLILMYNHVKGGFPVRTFERRVDGEDRGYKAMVAIADGEESVIQGIIPGASPKRSRKKLDPEEKARREAERQAERDRKRAEKEAAKAAKETTPEPEEPDEDLEAKRATVREQLASLKEEMDNRLKELREMSKDVRERFLKDIAALKEANAELLGRSGSTGPRRSFREYGFGRPAFPENIKQARAGTKVALMIDLLSRPEGVLMSELKSAMDATGRPVNVRAWLGYDLNDKHGYGFRGEPEGDDFRLKIVYPEGMTAPLEHIQPKKD